VFTKVMKYNLSRLPDDVIEIVGTHNFFALWLALMYYGGGAVIIYKMLKIGFPWPILIWLIAALVNIHFVMKFPGLFYLDDVSSKNFILSIIILGPINFLRALCLGITFIHRIKSPYPFTIRHFFRVPPETWSLDDPWIKAIQRSRDIEMPNLVSNIRWLLYKVGGWLWKVGNIRINMLMMLRLFLTLTVGAVLITAILVTYLKVIGKI